MNIVINKLGEEFDWIPKLNPDEKTGLANLLSGSSSNGSGPFGPMEITNNLNGLYEKNKDRLYKRSIEISQMGHQSYQLSFDHSFENLFRVFVFENWDDFKKRKKEIVDFILTNSIANNGDSDISEH